jgi:hypothetical protein
VSDIILAEYQGNAWLVRGERYIDDLLVNTLPRGIGIEIITCETETDVNDLWRQEGWDASQGRMPWIIHPGIMKRVRGTQSGQSILFGQWSALLDDDALDTIRATAVAAEEATGTRVFLISYTQPGQTQTMTDLTNLRYSLVETELGRLGVALSRIVREVVNAEANDNTKAKYERFDIRIGTG